MKRFIVIFCLFFISSSYGEYRDPRWFNRQTKTITKYLKTKEFITEATPSSCVVVQTSLPPCRHLRGLQIKPAGVTRIVPTNAPNPVKSEQTWKPLMHPSDPIIPPSRTPPLPMKEPHQPVVDSSAVNWDWDIFNLNPKTTITQTVREVFTQKYYDPNTVVTFSVKGCRPSKLPFDLSECKSSEQLVNDPIPERSVIVMAPVQFVPSLDSVISPAKSEIQPAKTPEEEVKKEEEEKEKPVPTN